MPTFFEGVLSGAVNKMNSNFDQRQKLRLALAEKIIPAAVERKAKEQERLNERERLLQTAMQHFPGEDPRKIEFLIDAGANLAEFPERLRNIEVNDVPGQAPIKMRPVPGMTPGRQDQFERLPPNQTGSMTGQMQGTGFTPSTLEQRVRGAFGTAFGANAITPNVIANASAGLGAGLPNTEIEGMARATGMSVEEMAAIINPGSVKTNRNVMGVRGGGIRMSSYAVVNGFVQQALKNPKMFASADEALALVRAGLVRAGYPASMANDVEAMLRSITWGEQTNEMLNNKALISSTANILEDLGVPREEADKYAAMIMLTGAGDGKNAMNPLKLMHVAEAYKSGNISAAQQLALTNGHGVTVDQGELQASIKMGMDRIDKMVESTLKASIKDAGKASTLQTVMLSRLTPYVSDAISKVYNHNLQKYIEAPTVAHAVMNTHIGGQFLEAMNQEMGGGLWERDPETGMSEIKDYEMLDSIFRKIETVTQPGELKDDLSKDIVDNAMRRLGFGQGAHGILPFMAAHARGLVEQIKNTNSEYYDVNRSGTGEWYFVIKDLEKRNMKLGGQSALTNAATAALGITPTSGTPGAPTLSNSPQANEFNPVQGGGIEGLEDPTFTAGTRAERTQDAGVDTFEEIDKEADVIHVGEAIKGGVDTLKRNIQAANNLFKTAVRRIGIESKRPENVRTPDANKRAMMEHLTGQPQPDTAGPLGKVLREDAENQDARNRTMAEFAQRAVGMDPRENLPPDAMNEATPADVRANAERLQQELIPPDQQEAFIPTDNRPVDDLISPQPDVPQPESPVPLPVPKPAPSLKEQFQMAMKEDAENTRARNKKLGEVLSTPFKALGDTIRGPEKIEELAEEIPEVKQLAEDEGLRLTKYKDTTGHDTIGYGHKMTAEDKKKYGDEITEEEAAEIYEEDVRKAKSGAERLLQSRAGQNAPEEVKNILTNMVFQMGEKGVSRFNKMFEAIKNADYSGAAVEMLDSKWAKQTPNRAKRLAERMMQIENPALEPRERPVQASPLQEAPRPPNIAGSPPTPRPRPSNAPSKNVPLPRAKPGRFTGDALADSQTLIQMRHKMGRSKEYKNALEEVIKLYGSAQEFHKQLTAAQQAQKAGNS